MNAMSTKGLEFQIVVLQATTDPHIQIPESLLAKGYNATVTADLEQALTALKNFDRPLLLADAGRSREAAIQLMRTLIEEKRAHPFPLLLLGQDIEANEKALGQYFRLALTMGLPYSLAELVDLLQFMQTRWNTLRAPVSLGAPGELSPPGALGPTGTPRIETPPPEALAPEFSHRLFNRGEPIADLLFSLLEERSITGIDVGGREYFGYSHEGRILENGALSDLPFREVIDTIMEGTSKWVRLHLLRVTLVSKQLAVALKLSEASTEEVRLAAILLAWSFSKKERELLRKDYLFFEDTQNVRKTLCSRIKDSAMRVAIELKRADVGNSIALIGRQIGREERVNDEQASIHASLVLASDLVDRVCYQAGFWNPRAAYNFLRRIKSGALNDIHPLVLAVVLKFLSEALASSPPEFLLPKAIVRDPERLAEAERLKTGLVEAHEAKIELAALAPGMRLTRPLKAFDGRQILEDDVVLDEDLILRIWQLSAVRPLHSHAVINAKR